MVEFNPMAIGGFTPQYYLGDSYQLPDVYSFVQTLLSQPIFNYSTNNTFVYNPDAVMDYSFMGLYLPPLEPPKLNMSLNKTPVKSGFDTHLVDVSNFGRNMVASARKYLGCNEADGSHMRFITSGKRNEPWCADFVSYIARENGVNINYPAVSGILDWGKRNGKFHSTPKVGDAIIFKGWDPKKGEYASHTGIVTKVENGRVYTIEGNTSNKVAERSYALNDSKISGYVSFA